MVLLAYEERTRVTLDRKDIESGKINLSEILTEVDFKRGAEVISIIYFASLLVKCRGASPSNYVTYNSVTQGLRIFLLQELTLH